jgi:hypothetical protein
MTDDIHAVPEGYPADALAFAVDVARRAGEIVRQVHTRCTWPGRARSPASRRRWTW